MAEYDFDEHYYTFLDETVENLESAADILLNAADSVRKWKIVLLGLCSELALTFSAPKLVFHSYQ
jgi:hypothetical protein